MIDSKIRASVRDIPNFPKEGILFKDITPILKDPGLCEEISEHLAQKYKNESIDAVAGIESRGFLFGMRLAQKLGVPFIPIRKSGKLPAETISYTYDLEYGTATVEIHKDALAKGARVLIHDDLLATGGTAKAAAELVKSLGAYPVAFAFIIELSFLPGIDVLKDYGENVYSIVSY